MQKCYVWILSRTPAGRFLKTRTWCLHAQNITGMLQKPKHSWDTSAHIDSLNEFYKNLFRIEGVEIILIWHKYIMLFFFKSFTQFVF